MKQSIFFVLCLGVIACQDPIRLLWKADLGSSSVSTPLVTDSFIAVGHETGVSVLEVDGTERCVFTTHQDVIAAPKTDGQRIFFGSTNYIFYAMDTGCTELWKYPAGDRIKSDPLIFNNTVYVSSYDGHVYALDTATGKQQWIFPKMQVHLSAAEKPAKRASKTKRGRSKNKQHLPSVDTIEPEFLEEMTVGSFSYSSPVLSDGILYLGNLDHHVYALDAATGTLKFRIKVDGPVTSTITVDAHRLYFGSNDGNVYGVDLKTQSIAWRFATHDWVNSSPRIVNDMLYIGSNDRHVYAIDKQSGQLRWKFSSLGPAIAIPVVYENLVFAAGSSGDGSVYALDEYNGKQFWTYKTSGKIESDPVLVGDMVYVSSADHYLYAFEIMKTPS